MSHRPSSKNNKTTERSTSRTFAEMRPKSQQKSAKVRRQLIGCCGCGCYERCHSSAARRLRRAKSAQVERDYLMSGRNVKYEEVACFSASRADAINSYSICKSVSFSTSCCLSCADAFSALEWRRT